MNIKSAWQIIKDTLNRFSQDSVLTLGAALSYYAIFSIGPLLMIIVSVAGLVLSEKAARNELSQQLVQVVGSKAAAVIQSMLAAQNKTTGIINTIIGIVLLLLGASGIFGQLKTSLNTIWHVKTRSGRGVLGLVLDRIVSILMVLGIGILLLLSMLLSTFLTAFYHTITSLVALPGFMLPPDEHGPA